MSIQFGIWNVDGKIVEQSELNRAGLALSGYSCDSVHSYLNGNIGFLYRSFHTTKESRSEIQPHISAGFLLTWDGRLDNRDELVEELPSHTTTSSTDVEIVAAAYDRWGTGCLARLLGDWALAVMNLGSKSLVLAKDFLGARHLFYRIDGQQIAWSTTLDPLVGIGKQLKLCEEYIAGWFSFFPAVHLTPFAEIHSVPPSSFVELRSGQQMVNKYWDFNPSKQIRYGSDAEYEEHFRRAIFQAVEPRLRSENPVLAHQSGGMDSSMVVTVADKVVARGLSNAPRVDTLSYISSSEPNWNELPYITKVEEQRGRAGHHIDVSAPELLKCDAQRLFLTPGSVSADTAAGRQFHECLLSQQYRVILSGIGGDEVTGGVPTPLPELQDLIASVQLRPLAHKLKMWALEKRKPWFYLLSEALREFLPPDLVRTPKHRQPPAWLKDTFVQRNLAALRGYPKRLRFLGPVPTFQENLQTLDALRRQLSSCSLPSDPTYETRYPILDRRFLEFLFAVPREQLVRPGMRRSLMRRALVGIVPNEIIDRRRKATVTRGPRIGIAEEWPQFLEMAQNLTSSSLGIIDGPRFLAVLQEARKGDEIRLVPLLRSIGIEVWFRNLVSRKLILCPTEHRSVTYSPMTAA